MKRDYIIAYLGVLVYALVVSGLVVVAAWGIFPDDDFGEYIGSYFITVLAMIPVSMLWTIMLYYYSRGE